MKKIKKIKDKRKSTLYEILVFAFLIFYTFTMLVIVYWGFSTSLKDKMGLRYNLMGLPDTWYKPWTWKWKNYVLAFEEIKVPIAVAGGTKNVTLFELLRNSILYCVTISFIGPLIPCITAYATAQFKDFKFNKVLIGIVLTTLVLPIYGNLAANLQLNKALGLYDSLLGVIVRGAGFTGVSFLVFRALFLSIPRSYSEAAIVDGAGNMRIMVSIMLPQAVGTYFTYVLLGFVGNWGDYTTPLIWLPSMPTLAYGLYKFSSSTENSINNIPLRVTACMITMLPVLIIYAVSNNLFSMNLSFGGVKE